MMMRLLPLLLLFIYSSSSVASSDLKKRFRKYEDEYRIPPGLAFAVAHQESGKKRNGVFAPYPWAVNIAGKGYWFETKKEAIRAAKNAVGKGKSFGGGYMQQEWRWQKHRYEKPEDVFDPETNIKTGAIILREWYDKTGSWTESIARYHVGYVKDKKELIRAVDYVEKVRKFHVRLASD